MNDKCEMFVKGRKNRKLPLIYLGVLLLCTVISVAAILYFRLPGFLMAFLVGVAGVYACFKIRAYNLAEYEYSTEGGELRISVIRNQASRKELLACDIKEIGSFGKVSLEDAFVACAEKETGAEIRLCCVGDESENVHYFVARGRDGKSYRVYFAPSEKLLEIMAQKNINIRKFRP